MTDIEPLDLDLAPIRARRDARTSTPDDVTALLAELAEEGFEIDKLRAHLTRLHTDATRALGALALLAAEHFDPGAEALEAQYCLTQTLVNTRRSLS